MNLKLGDLVLRKDKLSNLLFQVTEFDGQKVVIRGVEVPVITVVDAQELVKINKNRNKFKSILHLIQK